MEVWKVSGELDRWELSDELAAGLESCELAGDLAAEFVVALPLVLPFDWRVLDPVLVLGPGVCESSAVSSIHSCSSCV